MSSEVSFELKINEATYLIKVVQSAADGTIINYDTDGMWSTSPIVINDDGVNWNRGSGGFRDKGTDTLRNQYNESIFVTCGLELMLTISENKELRQCMSDNLDEYFAYAEHLGNLRKEQSEKEQAQRQKAFDAKMVFTYSDEKEILKALRELKAKSNGDDFISYHVIDRNSLDMENLEKRELVYRNGKFFCYIIDKDGNKKGCYHNGRTIQKDCVKWLENAVTLKEEITA